MIMYCNFTLYRLRHARLLLRLCTNAWWIFIYLALSKFILEKFTFICLSSRMFSEIIYRTGTLYDEVRYVTSWSIYFYRTFLSE